MVGQHFLKVVPPARSPSCLLALSFVALFCVWGALSTCYQFLRVGQVCELLFVLLIPVLIGGTRDLKREKD